MIASESVVLAVLVMLGVVMLYRGMLRERWLREQQERFLTGATHHLKTPLATVRLGIESLLMGSMPQEKQQQYLEAMVREVDHLEKDLTNLLRAGGLEDWRQGTELWQGDLAEDLKDALHSMRDRCDAAGVTVCTDAVSPALVERNREAVHLMLHNLIDNAVKYSKRGGEIVASLTRNDTMAVLTITDDGAGIAAEDLPHVFDRFYRGRDSGHRGGTGIGLFLVRELVTAHGGSVHVHSNGPGQGTSFELRFPLAEGGAQGQ